MSDTRSATHLKQQFNVDVLSGLFTGVFCSGIFNPWDRALYLSVKHQRPFLSRDNFHSPYHGFYQAVVQRAFLGSIYYILQGELKSYLYPYLRRNIGLNEAAAQCCIGISAGSISGLLTNSISAIKYHTWGQDNRSFRSSLREMWSSGGAHPFIKGTNATMLRDMVFGSTYEVLRNLLYPGTREDKNSFLESAANMASAGVATVTSGPFNYARTIQYATPPARKPPSIWRSLAEAWRQSRQHSGIAFGRLRFFQQQFRVGWGTARVAVGMAVGQKVFDWSRSQLNELYADSKNTHKR